MRAADDPGAELTTAELRDFRRLAGFMVPASAEYSVPGADDEAIFADIVRSVCRDNQTEVKVGIGLHLGEVILATSAPPTGSTLR
jgi:hypothetical protein